MTEQQLAACDFFKANGFLPVDKESYPLFKTYDKTDSILFETTATTSTIWAFAFDALYKVIHGYLCSVWFYHDGPVYIIVQRPWGTPESSLQQLVDTLYDLCIKAGLSCLYIWAVEEWLLKEYQALKGYDITNEHSDDFNEYIYRTEDLLELSGKSNFYKRKRLKKFLDAPTVSIRLITKENFHVCFEVEEKWCVQQDCALCGSYTGCAKTSLEIMADIFDPRIYQGIFGYIDDTPAGYAIWEKLNGKIAIVYFAKAIVSDFNVYLYYTMAKNYLAGITYVNNGQDVGKQGLRTFKKLLSDHEQLQKYLCIFEKTEGKNRE